MNILVLNLGSTSFKYELFDSDGLESLKSGNFKIQSILPNDFQEAVDKIFREILREVGDIPAIKFVAHRFVHGGDQYFAPQRIKEKDLYELEQLNHLAPLHNPANIAGIKTCLKYLPEAENYAVFDTAFFKDLPLSAKIYPLPYKYYESGIHKFGFHGISHKFAGEEAARKIKKDFQTCNLITIHLGGGCSITAIKKGEPIDTSMGLTPMEGLMMQTRSGDIDPGIILQMLTDEIQINTDAQMAIDKVKNILNNESGIKGISGYNDYLELLEAVERKETKAVLAFEMFTNRIKKYLGAYAALLDEVDAIVFTGKIGAGDPLTREKICAKMNLLKGIKIIVVEPHEELEIAREVKQILTN
ncbi:MAG TPA: acetate/propionate family kinase [bacterium]|nr:acetate/propionate family kinase [bacterium]